MSEEAYTKQRALESPVTLATVLHAIIRTQYGDAAYMWDPLTVSLEVRDDFKAEMGAIPMDRWSAIQIIMTTGAFFNRLDAFLGICNTLSSGEPFFQVFDPVTTEEAAWAITEVSLNRELMPFSYPIRKYLETVLEDDGYTEAIYPVVFKEVFGPEPAASDIRKELASLDNRDNVESYIDEQLKDLVVQFNRIPDLKDLDDIILHRSMDEFIGEPVNRE